MLLWGWKHDLIQIWVSAVWVYRLMPRSTSMTRLGQPALVTKVRRRGRLPRASVTSFGDCMISLPFVEMMGLRPFLTIVPFPVLGWVVRSIVRGPESRLTITSCMCASELGNDLSYRANGTSRCASYNTHMNYTFRPLVGHSDNEGGKNLLVSTFGPWTSQFLSFWSTTRDLSNCSEGG